MRRTCFHSCARKAHRHFIRQRKSNQSAIWPQPSIRTTTSIKRRISVAITHWKKVTALLYIFLTQIAFYFFGIGPSFFFFSMSLAFHCPYFLVFSALPLLSCLFFYFSPVMRHTDSSLSPSNSTEINFPELFHLGGPLSEFGTFSARDTPVRIHTGFLSPSPTVTKAHRQGTWNTHTHTHTSDSPHHCSLMSYLLHLCNIHLSPLTGPGSSIYPSYLCPAPLPSPHSPIPPPTPPWARPLADPFRRKT